MPFNPLNVTKTARRTFWSSVKKDNTTGCWLHTSSVGNVSVLAYVFNTQYVASRLAYADTIGDCTGRAVVQTCSNDACCNPKHLALGPKIASKGFSRFRMTHKLERLIRADKRPLQEISDTYGWPVELVAKRKRP